MTNKIFSRRDFMASSAKLGMLGSVASLGLLSNLKDAHAATDFKALVCVYLFGGNDGNNLIVPLDTARYTQYQKIRGPVGLALSTSAKTLLAPRTATLQAVASSTNQAFAFHYGMPEIDALYGLGKVAVVLNMGSLRQPLSKAQYSAGVGVPPQLFSHPDQTLQNQAGTPAVAATGWGGRLVDLLGTGGHLDAVALNSGGLFVEGSTVHGNLIPAGGSLNLSGLNAWPQSASDARKAALLQMLNASNTNVMAAAANKSLANGVDLVTDLQAMTSTATINTSFPGTPLAQQLKTVARLIKMRAAKGPGRQVYFVGMGGFDTHSQQAWTQWDNLVKVSQAMSAFYQAMGEIGCANQVTSFTMSDFGRSFEPTSNGSDHAWGSHHIVVGGAVQGGLYGQFPDFTLGGPDDATGRGAWIPQISNQQFGASLGRWFGASATMLETQVFKDELINFSRRDLGFMGP